MKVVFRADASRTLGSGHVMRCLTLADALRQAGWTCGFAVGAETADTVPALAASGHEIVSLDTDGAPSADTDGAPSADTDGEPSADTDGEPAAMAARWPDGPDWLVVDHYGRDQTFEASCRGWAGKIMVLDDLADRAHACDLLLDQALGRTPDAYRALVADDCAFLLGPKYALLRPQFEAARAASLERRNDSKDAQRVLISMGGTDPRGAAVMALEGIATSAVRIDVDVVADRRTAKEIKKMAASLTIPVTVHTEVGDMASLMAAADIAIGAGGTTSWERCCLGLPALVVITAENQRQNAETLERAGAVRILGWHEDVDTPTVAAGISKVLSDRAGCRAMSAAAAAICDGQGTLRVLLAMGGAEKTGRGGSVTLRLAEDEDCDLMLRWQRDPEVRRHFRNPQAPSAAEHQAWFRHCQEDPSRHLAMVVHEGRSAGVLRLDRTGDGQAYEISILIAPEMHKNGIAGAALSLIRKVMPGETFHAQVLPGNEASEALFRRAGFQAAGDTFFRSVGRSAGRSVGRSAGRSAGAGR